MRHFVSLVMWLAIVAPSAHADIPPFEPPVAEDSSPEPAGNRTVVIVIAAGVAILTGLLALSRITRRAPSGERVGA